MEMVDFWANLAKIRVKLRITGSGLSISEKLFLVSISGLGLVVFAAVQMFGPVLYQPLAAGIKYILAGIAGGLLAVRSFIVIYRLDKGISSMNILKSNKTTTQRYPLWQLRIKFSAFIIVAISFTISTFFWIDETMLKIPSTPPKEPTSNRSTQFSIEVIFYLYILAGICIFLQFSNLSSKIICWKTGSERSSSRKTDMLNSGTPKESHLSSNSPQNEHVLRESAMVLAAKEIAVTPNPFNNLIGASRNQASLVPAQEGMDSN